MLHCCTRPVLGASRKAFHKARSNRGEKTLQRRKSASQLPSIWLALGNLSEGILRSRLGVLPILIIQTNCGQTFKRHDNGLGNCLKARGYLLILLLLSLAHLIITQASCAPFTSP